MNKPAAMLLASAARHNQEEDRVVKKLALEVATVLDDTATMFEGASEETIPEGCQVVKFGGHLLLPTMKLKRDMEAETVTLIPYLTRLNTMALELKELVKYNRPYFKTTPGIRTYMKNLYNSILTDLEAVEILNLLLVATNNDDDNTA